MISASGVGFDRLPQLSIAGRRLLVPLGPAPLEPLLYVVSGPMWWIHALMAKPDEDRQCSDRNSGTMDARSPAGRRVSRLWPTSPAGNFIACFAIGVLLSVPAAFAGRILTPSTSQPGPPRSAFPASPEVEALIARGGQCFMGERLSDAFLDFNRARDLAPQDPRPHLGIGDVYSRLDRAELAEQSYREALHLDPESLPAKIRLARILRYLGKNDESVGLLNEVMRKQAQNSALWLELGRNELLRGNPRAAIPWLQKYTDWLPTNSYGIAHLGRAYAESGDDEAAEREYRRALDASPREALAWLWYGQLLVATGRKAEADQALANFRKYRDLEEQARLCERDLLRRPNDFMVLVKLAKARCLLGRYDAALTAMERAVQIRPDDADLRRLRDNVAGAAREAAEKKAKGKGKAAQEATGAPEEPATPSR